MDFTLPLLAVAFFIPLLAGFIVNLACLAYAYRANKQYAVYRRQIEGILKNEEALSNTLKAMADRDEKMLLILANVTNELLLLAQERIKRASMPPGKDF